MALIKWTDEYSVGIKSIDDQHKGLVSLINEFSDAMYNLKGQDELEKLFSDLVKYTQTHFKFEEELFKKYDYPRGEGHEREHQSLVKRVSELKDDFLNKDARKNIELNDFLKSWLTNHIMKSDKLYSEFLIEKGAK